MTKTTKPASLLSRHQIIDNANAARRDHKAGWINSRELADTLAELRAIWNTYYRETPAIEADLLTFAE